MNNWFSKLLENTDEIGQNGARVNLIMAAASILSLPLYIYLALQFGAWQMYVMAVSVSVFLILSLINVWLSTHNHGRMAMGIGLISLAVLVMELSAMISGLGVVLAVSVLIIFISVSTQTSMDVRTRLVIMLGIISAAATVLIDLFAPWERVSYPQLNSFIPIIAVVIVGIFAFQFFSGSAAWQNMQLGRKLLIAFGSLGILALVVGVVANTGLNRVQTSYAHAISDGGAMNDASLILSNNLLSARRHEKDFLLRWQEEGFDTAYANYVVANQEAVTAMLADVDTLDGFADTIGATFSDTYPQAQYETDLSVLRENTLLYEQKFQETVQLIEQRGFQDTGLEGQFRADVRNIESRILGREGLDPLVITMLTIRRHEKDYLLRGDQTYIDQLHDAVNELKDQIAASELLESAEKKEMTALADQYVVSFDTLVEKDVAIAVAIQEFRAAIRAMEPIVAKLQNAGVAMSQRDVTTAETTSRQTILLSSVTLTLALLAALVLSVLLSRQITNPVLSLTNTAIEISSGNFEIQADVTTGDEIGTLAKSFNTMTMRLGEAFEDVRRRAAELATVAEVSTATATILESQRLLQEVVDLTKERFNLYHSHIYLLDEDGKNLVLTAGAGEPGRIMSAEKRSIPLDRKQSLVARAARERMGVTVNDVTLDPNFLPNPLLPDTRSELAVPMIVGGNVVGVFDIQSEKVGRFTDSDINIQTTMAAQLATSIQNVRSFERSKKQAELQSLVNVIGSRIQRTSSIEDTLQTAIRELGTAIGATRVKVNLQAGQENNGAN